MSEEKETLNLMSFIVPMEKCPRCGEKHDRVQIKQLVNAFIVNESTTIDGYSWVKVIKDLDTEEPVPNMDGVNPKLFSNPMVIEIETNGDQKWKNNYTFWTYCPTNDEPVFLAIQVSFTEEAEEKSDK